MGKKTKEKSYSELSDLEKIQSNWKKIGGLFDRDEWSSAIVRAATASEIAANLAIRDELQVKNKLKSEFVDSLLLWANGIQGKFDRLLLPATKGLKHNEKFREVKKKVAEINKQRNSITHSGQFKKRSTANKVILDAKEVIEVLVGEYQPGFRLEDVVNHTGTSSRRKGERA